jgi:hypothetical protein
MTPEEQAAHAALEQTSRELADLSDTLYRAVSAPDRTPPKTMALRPVRRTNPRGAVPQGALPWQPSTRRCSTTRSTREAGPARPRPRASCRGLPGACPLRGRVPAAGREVPRATGHPRPQRRQLRAPPYPGGAGPGARRRQAGSRNGGGGRASGPRDLWARPEPLGPGVGPGPPPPYRVLGGRRGTEGPAAEAAAVDREPGLRGVPPQARGEVRARRPYLQLASKT